MDVIGGYDGKSVDIIRPIMCQREDAWNFLISKLEAYKADIRQKLDDMKREIREFPNGWNEDEDIGYNRALSDAQELLK